MGGHDRVRLRVQSWKSFSDKGMKGMTGMWTSPVGEEETLVTKIR